MDSKFSVLCICLPRVNKSEILKNATGFHLFYLSGPTLDPTESMGVLPGSQMREELSYLQPITPWSYARTYEFK